jgi:hypothetical protein
MPTLPTHLEADLESVYRPLLLTLAHLPIQGVDTMIGYPQPKMQVESTWSAAELDPADPIAPLEHDDAVSDTSEALGRRIMPMPELANPDGSPDLAPDLADAASRPVSPLRFIGPGFRERAEISSSRSDSSRGSFHDPEEFRRSADIDRDPEEKPVAGPIKIGQVSRERFRTRLREALEIVADESKPLTLGSLVTVVEEITELDARLSAMEQALEADRRSTRYIIGMTARSEAAASETRMRAEVAQLRSQVNTWRAQVPVPVDPYTSPPLATPQRSVTYASPPSKKGYRLG